MGKGIFDLHQKPYLAERTFKKSKQCYQYRKHFPFDCRKNNLECLSLVSDIQVRVKLERNYQIILTLIMETSF